jgi:hypothetical protein
VPRDYINSEMSITKQLNELLLLHISPVIYDPEAQPDVEPHLLLSSTETAWKMTENINVHSPVMISVPPKESRMKIDLSYILEGDFTSYFKGKDIPKPEAAVTEDTEEDSGISDELIGEEISIIEKSNGGKVFLIGSTKLITEGLFVANQQISNSVFVLNVLDYLNDREEQAVLRSKIQTLPSLKEDITPQVKSLTKTFNIFIIPICVIAFGILILILRTRRKRRIQLTFSKESEK